MDFAKLLSDAEKIPDPIEREKKLNQIARMMMGNPSRAAVTLPTPEGPTAPVANRSMRPTLENAQELQQLVEEVGLSQKIKPGQRMDAYTDEDLDKMVQDFSSMVTPQAAQAEIDLREVADEKGIMSPKTLNRMAGQVVAGSGEMLSSNTIGLAGLLTKAVETGVGKPLGSDQMFKMATDISDDIHTAVGISQPRNIKETLATLVPSVISMPGTGPVSNFGNLLEVVTPFVVGSGNKRVLANFATAFTADQAMRELGDDASTRYKTAFDVLPGEDKAHPDIYSGVLTGLALMTGASIVPAATAHLWKNHRANKPPKLVELRSLDPFAPRNLKTLEKTSDLMKTYFMDEKTVLSNLAERAGMPGIDRINALIDQDTQVSAVMRVNESMHTGKLSTVGGKFDVSISPVQLQQAYKSLPSEKRTETNKYLLLKDLTDDLKIRIRDNIGAREAQKKLRQVNSDLYTIEQSHPEVIDFHKKYQSIVSEVRKFQGQGPNSMHTAQELAALGVDRANFVPIDTSGVDPRGNLLERIADATLDYDQKKLDSYYTQKRDLRNIMDIDLRADSVDVLIDYTRNALKSKMENDVRGAYVRGLKNSEHGKDTIRKKNKRDRGVNPKRMVAVYENGKRETYLSSKLQAELLKFDPYIAKYPNIHSLKRGFEHTVTGSLSPLFAATTLIRDSIAGNVFTPAGMQTPGGPGAILGSAAKHGWAKMQRAAVDILRSDMDIPLLTTQQKDMYANQISNSYMNTMHALSNTVGGFDASIMKTNIENAKGIMRELGKAATPVVDRVPGARPAGRVLSAMAKGWIDLFDVIQEAPRSSFFDRNVKMGMDPVKAAREAKKLTGDTTRSGRVYDPRGQRLDADAVNKSLKAPAKLIGSAIESVRESVPWVNPAIQGLRRLGNRMIEDPVRTNLRAWAYVGLPTLAAQGWNETLGEEYNKYAFEGRSSRDIAMNLYIGIPGLPPERGIEIPLPHELTPFASPWSTALYALGKGAEGDEVTATIKHMAMTILENGAGVGFPQIGTAAMAFMGQKAPTGISSNPFEWKNDVYQIREDNVGVFPQNVEETLRATWGGIAGLALNSSAAAHEGGIEAFFDELGTGLINQMPIAKGLFGNKTPVTNFTPVSEQKRNKIRGLRDFLEMYDAHFNKEGLRVKPSGGTKGVEPNEADPKHTVYNLAPINIPKPTNIIIKEFGDMIKSHLDTNEVGWSGINTRYSVISDQISLLKEYHAGRKGAFKEHQKEFENADEEFQARLKTYPDGKIPKKDKTEVAQLGEKAKAARLIKDMGLDLSKRRDVTRLVAALETERQDLIDKQMQIVTDLENKITGELKARMLIKPDQSFKIEKHLGQLTPTDLLATQQPGQ